MIPATTEFYEWFNAELDVCSLEGAFNAGWSKSFEVHNAKVNAQAVLPEVPPEAWIHAMSDAGHAAGCDEWQLRAEMREAYKALRRLTTPMPDYADVEATPWCSVCNGYGRYQTGTSGRADDGDAPDIEECECSDEERRPECRRTGRMLSSASIQAALVAWFSPDHPDQGNYTARMRKALDAAKAATGEETTDEPRLDRPAKVGGVRFGKGVKWSTVIGAAQRKYEYEVTPEKEAARIKRARTVMDEFTASCDQVRGLKYRCTLCGESDFEARRDGCVNAPCPMELISEAAQAGIKPCCCTNAERQQCEYCAKLGRLL